MDLDLEPNLFRKIRITQLEPELQKEILEFAGLIGHETTVKTSGRLEFLYKFYQAEKAKEKRSRRMLRKAERLILKLESLRHETQRRDLGKQEKDRGREIWRGPSTAAALPIAVSKRMRMIFQSIGIEDERFMAAAIELLGEQKIETRVELVCATTLGGDLVKKAFSALPERLLVPDDDQFLSELSAAETKKEIMDAWAKERGIPISEAPYNTTPALLFEKYHELQQMLELQTAQPAAREESEEKAKYRPKPMHPDDLVTVLVKGFGFMISRERKERVLTHPDGRVLSVEKAHTGQMDLNRGTVRAFIRDAGLEPDEFETERRRLGL